MRQLALPCRVPTAVLLTVALAAGTGCANEAGAFRHWSVDFAGVRGVRPGMTVAEVARRWHVRFSFSTGSSPGCKIGGFKRDGVAGGARFQDDRFDAVWFESGVASLGGVKIGSRISDLRRVYGDRLRQVRNLYDVKRPLFFVRGGQQRLLLEFFSGRDGRIETIGFGDAFVLVQEGCN